LIKGGSILLAKNGSVLVAIDIFEGVFNGGVVGECAEGGKVGEIVGQRREKFDKGRIVGVAALGGEVMGDEKDFFSGREEFARVPGKRARGVEKLARFFVFGWGVWGGKGKK
jgi:hypothetical protein